jgi:hypothetical protein
MAAEPRSRLGSSSVRKRFWRGCTVRTALSVFLVCNRCGDAAAVFCIANADASMGMQAVAEWCKPVWCMFCHVHFLSRSASRFLTCSCAVQCLYNTVQYSTIPSSPALSLSLSLHGYLFHVFLLAASRALAR